MSLRKQLMSAALAAGLLQGCGVPEATTEATGATGASAPQATADPARAAAIRSEAVDGEEAERAAIEPAGDADKTSTCSCYGPGLYGNRTACGQILRTDTIGVAHKTKPCGTRLQFRSRSGSWVSATVIDRGPFAPGREFDLTEGLVKKLGYSSCTAFGVRSVEWN
ncbi:MAG: RlpA-like double-psi beta-barrel domain-containing protein [Polyangia bacterium]